MTRTIRLELAALAVIAIGLSFSSAASAQAVNPSLAKRGKYVWENKGCYMCHAFGSVRGGPDLKGIMDRREHGWLRRWLKNTDEMIASDPQAMAMVETYKKQKMPNMKLSDADIEALFHYFNQETRKLGGS